MLDDEGEPQKFQTAETKGRIAKDPAWLDDFPKQVT
jgi:hypothetical protein